MNKFFRHTTNWKGDYLIVKLDGDGYSLETVTSHERCKIELKPQDIRSLILTLKSAEAAYE